MTGGKVPQEMNLWQQKEYPSGSNELCLPQQILTIALLFMQTRKGEELKQSATLLWLSTLELG